MIRGRNRMKYTDEQRIAKIKEYTDKLLEYVKKAEITRETISDDETIQWTLTTPLYNIGEQPPFWQYLRGFPRFDSGCRN